MLKNVTYLGGKQARERFILAINWSRCTFQVSNRLREELEGRFQEVKESTQQQLLGGAVKRAVKEKRVPGSLGQIRAYLVYICVYFIILFAHWLLLPIGYWIPMPMAKKLMNWLLDVPCFFWGSLRFRRSRAEWLGPGSCCYVVPQEPA